MTGADRVHRAGHGAPEKTPMAEHIKNVDVHGPEKRQWQEDIVFLIQRPKQFWRFEYVTQVTAATFT